MRLTSPLFDVYVDLTGEKPVKQKQVSVGARVYKKAVDRNRLKRQMRAIIGQFFLPKEKFIRVVAKGGAVGKKFAEIKADLEKILNKL